MYSNIKRFFCIMLALVLCFAFTACKESGKAEESTGASETESTADVTETTEETAARTTQETQSVETTEATEVTEATEATEERNVQEERPVQPPVADPPPAVSVTLTEAEKAFFEGAAFIGDSVTLKLRNYNTQKGALGNTTFLCQGSYSVAHAVNNTMYLSYQGQDTTPQDALAACGAKRVFILLGMNDIALWGIDKTMENWATLVANIRGTCPDIEIYIQSGTPIYTGGEIGSLNNNNVNKYNARLQEFAQANGCYYVDVNTSFKDSTGGLASYYCSDEYVHFTDAACELWVKILSELI